MPMVGSTVRTPDGLGTVLEVNPVSGYLRGGKRAPKAPDKEDE